MWLIRVNELLTKLYLSTHFSLIDTREQKYM